jgi:predicted Rossmann-fold nucleotide-binding protein
MADMRVLVCGGRDYDDMLAVFNELQRLREKHGPLTIIQGGATGADRLARQWCMFQKGKAHMINEPANWQQHGRAAGPIRNQLMIDEHKPDLVVAFPGGRGTADMIRRAKAAGIEVREPAKHNSTQSDAPAQGEK